MPNIKILTYNILHGFYDPLWTFEPQRLAAAQRIIKRENADILCITEACHKGPGAQQAYKEMFNYPCVFWAQWGDYWGNAILSKQPIAETRVLPLGERTGIRAVFNINNTELMIDVVHPDPEITDKDRIQILEPIIITKKEPYILTGDFNTLSDEDTYDRARLIGGLKGYLKEKTETTVDQMLTRGLTPELRKLGLRDAMPKDERTFTLPTDYLYKEKDCAMRLDYFFISKDVNVQDAHVIRNGDAEKASDHYPIIGTFII